MMSKDYRYYLVVIDSHQEDFLRNVNKHLS